MNGGRWEMPEAWAFRYVLYVHSSEDSFLPCAVFCIHLVFL